MGLGLQSQANVRSFRLTGSEQRCQQLLTSLFAIFTIKNRKWQKMRRQLTTQPYPYIYIFIYNTFIHVYIHRYKRICCRLTSEPSRSGILVQVLNITVSVRNVSECQEYQVAISVFLNQKDIIKVARLLSRLQQWFCDNPSKSEKQVVEFQEPKTP